MFWDIFQNSQNSSVAELIFQKIASLRSVTLLTPAYMFSCEFCKSFRNTYFVEHLRTAASVFHFKKWLPLKDMEWISLKWLASLSFFHYLFLVITVSKIITILRYLHVEKGERTCRRPISSSHQAPTIYICY